MGFLGGVPVVLCRVSGSLWGFGGLYRAEGSPWGFGVPIELRGSVWGFGGTQWGPYGVLGSV